MLCIYMKLINFTGKKKKQVSEVNLILSQYKIIYVMYMSMCVCVYGNL